MGEVPRDAGGARDPGRWRDERLALAVEAAGLGSWEYSLATGELAASDQCKANHGLAPSDPLTLDSIIDAIDAAQRQAFRNALEATVRTGVDFALEVPNTWPDGSHHWLLIRGRMMDDTCLLGVTMDITERRRMEEALRMMDSRKDDFLAVLGHELRNPLASIVAAARFLEVAGTPDPKLQNARETIIRQSMQITKIVDDLMDVGRINAGKLSLNRARIEVSDLLQQAVETCLPMVERRRHTLTLAPPGAPVRLDVDPTRMVQVVCNLITNAAKYMNEGGRIFVSGAAEPTGEAVIRVRDEGIGIAPEMLEIIFQRFVQIRGQRDNSAGGLGLGLSLVKALVEMHDGTVEARSDGVGQGSEFIVRLPAAQ
jgi:signal transduction histidine kinase